MDLGLIKLSKADSAEKQGLASSLKRELDHMITELDEVLGISPDQVSVPESVHTDDRPAYEKAGDFLTAQDAKILRIAS